MIEKVYLPKEVRLTEKPDGTFEQKVVEPWEVRWKKDEKKDPEGKEKNELADLFKDSAPAMMHEGWKEWNGIGETKITRPDGSTDVVRADKEHLYRRQPGFCVKATRPVFVMSGFGGMKRAGLIRARYAYRDGERVTLEER